MNFIELFVVPTVVKRFFSVINMGVVFIQVLVFVLASTVIVCLIIRCFGKNTSGKVINLNETL